MNAFSYSQWMKTDRGPILPYSVWCSGDVLLELKKDSDTLSFTEWYNNLSINCPEINNLVKTDIENAYLSAKSNELLYPAKNSIAAIENIDMKILFRNHDNKIRIVADWTPEIVEYRIEAQDATINKLVLDNEFIFTVNPKGTECIIKIIGKDKKGTESIILSSFYKVIPLPGPKLKNETLSKKNGTTLEIETPEILPLMIYSIESVEIQGANIPIQDDLFISPIHLKKLKKGSIASLILIIRELESGNRIKAAYTLAVTE
jgi:hypothetical protein